MNERQTTISEEEIHAYVDGTLAPERRDEIDQMLERQPELADRISHYFSLNNLLHERYDRVLDEPVPARLQLPAKRRWREAANWPQFAGIAAALLVGVGIGIGSNFGSSIMMAGRMGPTAGQAPVRDASFTPDPGQSFARQSAIAHVVYAPEVTRPVEVGADREQELVKWVSSRLGTDVRPPVLTRTGFELMGGRLLPSADGPVAQFMYHDHNGERITLCISRRKTSTNTTAFKLYQDGPVNVFYWIDGDVGYAVSGGINRKELLEIAHDVYAQLTPDEGGAPKAASGAN